MEPLAHGAIRSRHRGDLREHDAFPVCLVRARARGRLLRGLLGGALGASDTFSHFRSLSLDASEAVGGGIPEPLVVRDPVPHRTEPRGDEAIAALSAMPLLRP